MGESYDQREAFYAAHAERAFPDAKSPLTSRQRVSSAIREAVESDSRLVQAYALSMRRYLALKQIRDVASGRITEHTLPNISELCSEAMADGAPDMLRAWMAFDANGLCELFLDVSNAESFAGDAGYVIPLVGSAK